MNRKLFNKDVEPACEHCTRGKKTADGKQVLCLKKGVMPLHGRCNSYRYDPFRRIPKPKPTLLKYDPSEFKL